MRFKVKQGQGWILALGLFSSPSAVIAFLFHSNTNLGGHSDFRERRPPPRRSHKVVESTAWLCTQYCLMEHISRMLPVLLQAQALPNILQPVLTKHNISRYGIMELPTHPINSEYPRGCCYWEFKFSSCETIWLWVTLTKCQFLESPWTMSVKSLKGQS